MRPLSHLRWTLYRRYLGMEIIAHLLCSLPFQWPRDWWAEVCEAQHTILLYLADLDTVSVQTTLFILSRTDERQATRLLSRWYLFWSRFWIILNEPQIVIPDFYLRISRDMRRLSRFARFAKPFTTSTIRWNLIRKQEEYHLVAEQFAGYITDHDSFDQVYHYISSQAKFKGWRTGIWENLLDIVFPLGKMLDDGLMSGLDALDEEMPSNVVDLRAFAPAPSGA